MAQTVSSFRLFTRNGGTNAPSKLKLAGMCGICGVIGERRSEQAESRVRRMLAAQVHRGPDDEGMLLAPGTALGMRRLSIIDLAGGRQPVFNEDKTVGIVFNGEIYNFPELRASLENKGHCFQTHSDTEVIVHAYEEWGPACLEQLRGMFAFALWDARPDSGRPSAERSGARVLLARDRLGIKPLYYAVTDGALLFASEVRALLASGVIARRIAPQSVEAYLLFGSVVEPATLVEGVFSLPPGHWMMIPVDSVPHRLNPTPYWDLAKHQSAARPPTTLAGASPQARALLEGAVRSHLLADVPLGLFLSSGLDSTAIAALAASERKGLHTFTVVFEEQQFSEASVARQTAKKLGTEHRELLLTGGEMLSRLGEALSALDQPSMDGTNTFFVSWAARQVGLKVALSGLGGDEVFGGYPTFRWTPRMAWLSLLGRYLPAAAREPLAAKFAAIGGRALRRRDMARKLAALWQEGNALPHAYFYARALFTPHQVDSIFSTPVRAALVSNENAENSPWKRWLEETARQALRLEGDTAVSYLELRTYMVNTLLRDTDSMSMHHSLEVRVPLLDHPLVEFVAGLPTRAKRRSDVNKVLLVEALGDLLPQEVVHQRKRTFTLPWESWLRGPLGSQVGASLGALAPSLAELLDSRAVRGVWTSFLAGHTTWGRAWSLYVLNDWVRRNLDDPPSTAEREHFAAGAAAAS